MNHLTTEERQARKAKRARQELMGSDSPRAASPEKATAAALRDAIRIAPGKDIEGRQQAFVDAVKRNGIRSIDAPDVFGVTRETFSHWLNGKTKVPFGVFLALIKFENRAYLDRIAALGVAPRR